MENFDAGGEMKITTFTTRIFHLDSEMSEATAIDLRKCLDRAINEIPWCPRDHELLTNFSAAFPKEEYRDDYKTVDEPARGYYHCTNCGTVAYVLQPCPKCGGQEMAWVAFGPDDERHGPGTDTTIEWIATEQQLDRINTKISMGQAADGGDAGCANSEFPRDIEIMERRSAIHDATIGIPPKVPTATNSQSDVAGVPDVRTDAATADAADRLSKLARVCSGRSKNGVAEEFDRAAQRSAKFEWDKRNR